MIIIVALFLMFFLMMFAILAVRRGIGQKSGKNHLQSNSEKASQSSELGHIDGSYLAIDFNQKIEHFKRMLKIAKQISEYYGDRLESASAYNLQLTSSIFVDLNEMDFNHSAALFFDLYLIGKPDLKSVSLTGKRKNIVSWGGLMYRPKTLALIPDKKNGWIYAYSFVSPGSVVMGQGEEKYYGGPSLIFVKIGMTTQKNPIVRIDQQLGTSNPMPAVLFFLGEVVACRDAEKKLHRKLRKEHLEHGSTGKEWFLVKAKYLHKILYEFCFSWNAQHSQLLGQYELD